MDIQKERKAFEAYMADRYKNTVDQRVCINSDGDYMAWDMQVAWHVWQAAKAQAVPSKLDEINNWAKWHIEDYQISESNEHDRGWYNACCAVVNMLEAQEQSR